MRPSLHKGKRQRPPEVGYQIWGRTQKFNQPAMARGAIEMGDGKLLRPADLQKLTEETLQAKAKEEINRVKKQEEEKKHLREVFMSEQIVSEAADRVNAMVRRAAEQGLREIEVLRFPASYCSDKGRRINNAEPDWPDSLEGIARRAYEYYLRELQPLKFKVRAQVLSFPDGRLGDIGLFLSW